jgi:hypothetical protein
MLDSFGIESFSPSPAALRTLSWSGMLDGFGIERQPTCQTGTADRLVVSDARWSWDREIVDQALERGSACRPPGRTWSG